jgi:hypothetical protein
LDLDPPGHSSKLAGVRSVQVSLLLIAVCLTARGGVPISAAPQKSPSNAVRDLLALDVDSATLLPIDDSTLTVALLETSAAPPQAALQPFERVIDNPVDTGGVPQLASVIVTRLDAANTQGRTPLDEALASFPPREQAAGRLRDVMTRRGIPILPPKAAGPRCCGGCDCSKDLKPADSKGDSK